MVSVRCFLRQDMSSAILMSTVLIHWELMPSGELINREQKKQPSKRPILDLLHVCRVQERAEELSVTFRSTGYGSSVISGVVCRTQSAAMQFMITVMYSRTFIDIEGASWNSKVRSMISLGKRICHQNPKLMENPPAPSKELSPIVVAKGVRGMRCANGVSQSMPESGLSLS